jgi:3-phenylpropionate/trans-cinnamate dioxygenase ferredoxin reductase subunit
MPRRHVYSQVYGPAARLGWLLLYVAALMVPLVLTWTVRRSPGIERGEALVLSAGLVAFSALVVAVVLPARLPMLIGAFGIETILRIHRLVALVAGTLVLLHLVAVLFVDPRGFSVLDLRLTTWAARAGICSTVALVLLIVLAILRPRRLPRYEGWRLVHNALVAVVLITAWLHVWLLQHLVSHPLLAAWFAGTALLLVYLAGRRWILLPLRARRHPYMVEEVCEAAGDAVTLVITALGHAGVPFKAGQFAWLKIGSTPFVFEEHPFSIASTAVHPERKEFTIKALGDFTELLGALRPGRKIYLDGPYGGFTIEGRRSAEGFVMIAAGVGITPLLSMLRTLADRGDRRRHWLILAARTAEELMLQAEVEEVRRRLNLKVVEVVSSPGPGWTGETGRIDTQLLARQLPRRPHRFDYFLCGPPSMVAAVSRELHRSGVPLRRIHTEQFDAV